MAIFVASTKSISRSKKQSAVAAACYRTADKIADERYGKTHDYTKRSGVMSADIIMPTALENTAITRAELWNLAERSENRKNSRVAREWLISLPHELDEASRKTLAHDFSRALADKFGVITDCAIHQPTDKEIARGADPRNFHAHIMLTTRKAELDANGSVCLTTKSDCELSDTDRDKKGLSRAKDEVTEIRELWQTLANKKLAEHEHSLIDSRSHRAQGLDIVPQIKMGKDATHLERKGIRTDKGDENRAIQQRNELVAETKQRQQRAADERHTVEYIEWSTDRIEWANNRHQQVVKRVDDSQQRIESNQRGIAWATRKNESTPRRTRRAKHAASRFFQRIVGSKSDIQRSNGNSECFNRSVGDSQQCIEGGKRGIAWAVAANAKLDEISRNNSELIAWTNKRTKRVHKDVSSAEQQATNITEQERRVDREINRTARHSERINKYLARPRPSPFRERISATKQRIDATKRQVTDSEQGVDDRYREARSRQEEFDRATRRTKTIISGRAKYLLAVFARPTEQGFDERQLATFKAFAAEKRFKSLEEMRVFFSDYDNARQHKAFISMMLYPEKERRTFSEAHQSLETSLEGKDTNLESKALESENRANTSLPNEPTAPVRRKYRP